MKKELLKKYNFEAALPNCTKDINSILEKLLKFRVDPGCEFYNVTLEDIMKDVKQLNTGNVTAIASDIPVEKKGIKFDPILEDFIKGCGGQITNNLNIDSSLTTPVAIRGLGRSKQIKECIDSGRDFYFIDTGYFGNTKKKLFHRITKNDLQNLGPTISRPRDRLAQAGWEKKKFTKGSDILLCPPSEKVMKHFELNLNEWIQSTVEEIKKHTDRKIVIREKKPRPERVVGDTIYDALDRDVHCLVTFNSIASIEALLYGKPAFTLGPNAAHSLCLSDLSQIETPYIPTLDEVEELLAHLAYCQFTLEEMSNGYAWMVLNNQI